VLGEARAAEMPKLDIPGAVLVCAGVMAALYGLTALDSDGTVRPVLSFVVSAILLGSFYLWERRTPAPLVRMFSPDVHGSSGYRAAFLSAAGLVVCFAALSLSQTRKEVQTSPNDESVIP